MAGWPGLRFVGALRPSPVSTEPSVSQAGRPGGSRRVPYATPEARAASAARRDKLRGAASQGCVGEARRGPPRPHCDVHSLDGTAPPRALLRRAGAAVGDGEVEWSGVEWAGVGCSSPRRKNMSAVSEALVCFHPPCRSGPWGVGRSRAAAAGVRPCAPRPAPAAGLGRCQENNGITRRDFDFDEPAERAERRRCAPGEAARMARAVQTLRVALTAVAL